MPLGRGHPDTPRFSRARTAGPMPARGKTQTARRSLPHRRACAPVRKLATAALKARRLPGETPGPWVSAKRRRCAACRFGFSLPADHRARPPKAPRRVPPLGRDRESGSEGAGGICASAAAPAVPEAGLRRSGAPAVIGGLGAAPDAPCASAARPTESQDGPQGCSSHCRIKASPNANQSLPAAPSAAAVLDDKRECYI